MSDQRKIVQTIKSVDLIKFIKIIIYFFVDGAVMQVLTAYLRWKTKKIANFSNKYERVWLLLRNAQQIYGENVEVETGFFFINYADVWVALKT